MRLIVSADTSDVVESLRSRGERLRSPRLFRLLADEARRASARQFASGAGWDRPEDGGRPLIETGTLRDSLTRAGARYQRVTTIGDSVEVESTVPYAQYQRNDPSKVDERALERAGVAVLMSYLMEG